MLAEGQRWSVERADCLEFLRGIPEQSVDLVFGSPPYEKCRTYGINFNLSGQAWVSWMVEVFQESLRVCKGLVGFVLQGPTKKFRWSATPAMLMADLHRAGVHLRNPPIFHRVGIPGSGGPDWLRSNYEWIVCATNGGKLPWSDNKAMGHKPKWAPGGEMSNRKGNGARVNRWGGTKISTFPGTDGKRKTQNRASHVYATPVKGDGIYAAVKTGCANGQADGDVKQDGVYRAPAIANPGNVLKYRTGGGHMGSPLAHGNEAPFPQKLAEFFVRSFCPPGGIVCDCFAGSGTTGAAAIEWQRRFIGCDVRESEVARTRRRLSQQQPRFEEIV